MNKLCIYIGNVGVFILVTIVVADVVNVVVVVVVVITTTISINLGGISALLIISYIYYQLIGWQTSRHTESEIDNSENLLNC